MTLPSGENDKGLTSTARPSALVLGAGLAGLSAAWRLSKAGWKVTVIEAEPQIGGLASSKTIKTEWGEFDYDNGPHRYYSNEESLMEEVAPLMGDDACMAIRQSRIFLYDKFFDYPLKSQNILGLPKLVLLRVLVDYAWIKFRNLFHRRPDDNFENWVVNRFGRKLYKVFFGVYTEKTWGIPCTEISADWAAQRISLLSLWDTIKKTLFKPKNTPRTLVSSFKYPRRGGIGTITRKYESLLLEAGQTVVTGAPVKHLVLDGKRVAAVECETADGIRRFEADQVISTIPVTTLAHCFKPSAPKEVIDAVGRLKHRSMIFVYLILDREKLTDDHWIYLPEMKLTTHRLSEFKNFSPDSAPKDKTLICAEITCDFKDADWNKSDEELRQIVVEDLTKRIPLIQPEEVLMTFSSRERYAYPIYDLGYRENRDCVLGFIDGIENLETTGRQGLFKYNNMDHSVGMGLAVADSLQGEGDDHRKVASGSQYFG